MRPGFEIWRQRLALWLPALVFFAVSLGLLSVYRLTMADESAGLEQRLVAREHELDGLTARRQELEDLNRRARLNRERIDELYAQRFSTQRQRFTQILDEVKTLARQAGLEPQAFQYPEEPIEGYELVERSFVFGVEGTYQQLRTFINFLELSSSFLTLEQVTLTGNQTDGRELTINLSLSTLFVSGTAEGGEVPAS